MNSTTTCAFYNPVVIGQAPGANAQFASSTCSTIYAGVASTTAGITYGEAINSVLLFAILILVGYSALVVWVRGIKIKFYK